MQADSKYSMMDSGELFVMMAGISMMLKWCAGNLDTVQLWQLCRIPPMDQAQVNRIMSNYLGQLTILVHHQVNAQERLLLSQSSASAVSCKLRTTLQINRLTNLKISIFNGETYFAQT